MATRVVKPQSDAQIIAQLRALGFNDTVQERKRRLIVSSGGREKTGKSHFGLSGPSPIVYLNVDIGTEGVVEKFQEQGKQVLLFDVRVPRESKQDIWTNMWSDFKVKVRKVYDLKEGTVVWDTASELYELARLAHFGRLTDVKPSDYAVVNNEWKDVLRIAYDSPVNTVFLQKMKAIWRVVPTSGGRSSLTKTNDFETSGFADMDYLTQVNLIHYREDTEAGTVFSVFVKDCRSNPGIAGTVMRGLPLPSGQERTLDPLCNFENLLSLVHD
tara:strand:+ start:6896 stop:7708 length:813 start_codon:yes stop_codon:yes gene_type:complete